VLQTIYNVPRINMPIAIVLNVSMMISKLFYPFNETKIQRTTRNRHYACKKLWTSTKKKKKFITYAIRSVETWTVDDVKSCGLQKPISISTVKVVLTFYLHFKTISYVNHCVYTTKNQKKKKLIIQRIFLLYGYIRRVYCIYRNYNKLQINYLLSEEIHDLSRKITIIVCNLRIPRSVQQFLPYSKIISSKFIRKKRSQLRNIVWFQLIK